MKAFKRGLAESYQTRNDSSNSEAILDVAPEALNVLGFQSVIASQETDPHLLSELLQELRSASHSHTWRWFHDSASTPLFQQLLDFENKKRPTHFFFYHGMKADGRRTLLGAGTVAERINNAFPYAGFPVIARCYVNERFRSHRLYAPILTHRFQMCQKIWGDELKCVHLGSSNPRIFAAIKRRQLGLPFIYVGNENLGPDGDSVKVRDFVWLSPQFQQSLLSASKPDVRSLEGSPEIEAFDKILRTLLSNEGDETTYWKLNSAVVEVEQKTGWSPKRNDAFREFMTLLATIPVLARDTHDEDPAEESVFHFRQSRP